jgi:hypothetical protein
MQKHFSILWQLADVCNKRLDDVGRKLRTEGRHFRSALADNSGEFFIGLFLDLVRLGVFPLPSGPWHNVQLFLNTLAASLWARATTGRMKIVKVIKNVAGAKRCSIFCM